MRRFRLLIFLIVIFLGSAYALREWYQGASTSNRYIYEWLTNAPAAYANDALIRCGNAPFILPSAGFIGLLWRDTAVPYSVLKRHTGIDIFGKGSEGTIPVYAAYEGYLSRLDSWFSTVIIQHTDPLVPNRNIWTYYTHMASRDSQMSFISSAFPQGTYGVFVEQGTLLGYQGTYNPPFPIATHLHFSIVTSGEDGSFKNEALIENTLDPTPYLGLNLNTDSAVHPVHCDI